MSSHDGEPLPAAVRKHLERALNADLKAVRVHVGPAADRLVRLLGVDAVGGGADIYFRDGAYRPDTPNGLRLLAHEAIHLVQQAEDRLGRVRGSGPENRREQRTERFATAFIRGTEQSSADRVTVIAGEVGARQRRNPAATLR